MTRLGDRLVEMGVVSRQALEDAMASARPGERCGSRLIAIGAVSQDTVARALAALHGVHAACTTHFEAVGPDLAALIPADLARRKCMVPIGFVGVDPIRLAIAMLDPLDESSLQAIADATGYPLIPAVAPELAIRAAIAKHYPVADPMAPIDLDEPGLPRSTWTSVSPPVPPNSTLAEPMAGREERDMVRIGGISLDGVEDGGPPLLPDHLFGPPGVAKPVPAPIERGSPPAGPSRTRDPLELFAPDEPGAPMPGELVAQARALGASGEPAPVGASVVPAVVERKVGMPSGVAGARRFPTVPVAAGLLVVGITLLVAIPMFKSKAVPTSAAFHAKHVGLHVDFSPGWMHVPANDLTTREQGVITREMYFYRGKNMNDFSIAMSLSTIEVPIDTRQLAEKDLESILLILQTQFGGRVAINGLTIKNVKCWRSEDRPMTGECSGDAAKGGTRRTFLMYLFPQNRRFTATAFFHQQDYDVVAAEINRIVDSVMEDN